MQPGDREKSIYRVTCAGSVVNLLLVAFKFVAGTLGHSVAMVADAVHSLSDLATDIVVLVFTRISNKPQDKSHDYGHGKYETLATAVIGIALFGVGLGIFRNGVMSIRMVWQGATLPVPGVLALAGALISVVAKELLFRYTIHVGRVTGSSAVTANAWHHRSDALSSVGTAIGIGGAILLGDKWSVLDPIAAVMVSIFIMKVSFQLLYPCIGELTEKSLPDNVEREISEIAENTPGVSSLHNLRTRRIGSHYAIEMHIRLDGHISLFEAHRKASSIEARLRERFGNGTHVGIHVEPVKNADGTYSE